MVIHAQRHLILFDGGGAIGEIGEGFGIVQSQGDVVRIELEGRGEIVANQLAIRLRLAQFRMNAGDVICNRHRVCADRFVDVTAELRRRGDERSPEGIFGVESPGIAMGFIKQRLGGGEPIHADRIVRRIGGALGLKHGPPQQHGGCQPKRDRQGENDSHGFCAARAFGCGHLSHTQRAAGE